HQSPDQTVSGVSSRNAGVSHVEHGEGHAVVRRNYRGDLVPGSRPEVKHSLRPQAAESGPRARRKDIRRSIRTWHLIRERSSCRLKAAAAIIAATADPSRSGQGLVLV